MIHWTSVETRLPAADCRVILRFEGPTVEYEIAWYQEHPAAWVGTQCGADYRVTHWAMVNAP